MGQIKEIQFPLRGVARRDSLRSMPDSRGPFPTPWATNVRLEGSLDTRLRGGSFTAQAAGTKADPVYRDRAITFSDNAITAARQGDSTDTALSTDVSDTRRPILFQLSLAGTTGEDVVSVVPHKDAFLICFTAGETWVLIGDPATGTLRRISDEVGIVGVDAWCVAHDTVYFLSSQGLYSVNADGGGLSAVSENAIPEELTGVTDSTTVLDYNHADRGVYIHIPAADVSWFYDTAREGFWPFDRDVTDSHVLCGPFRLGKLNQYGRILHLQGNIAAGSADVNWRLIPGVSAEEAADNGKLAIEAHIASSSYSSYIHAVEGTWSAGRSNRAYPRMRSVFCCLWLQSAGSWAYESASVEVLPSGKWRGE